MEFLTHAEPTNSGSEKKNVESTHVISLIFITCVLLLAPYCPATAQPIHIPDPKLRSALEIALSKAPGADITQADMASLGALDAFAFGIRDLTGLEFATNLTELHLGFNAISDISPLKNLINLIHLDLHRNRRIRDVSPLKNLTNLTWLSLRGNRISDMSPLRDLTKLTYLHVAYNRISDVSAFKNLTNLTFLDIEAHIISDLSPLENLTNLTYLDFDSNRVSDVSPLAGLTKLTELDASDNQIADVSALKNLINLTYVDLDDNRILDISALQNMTNLGWLDLDDNQNISDISPLQNLIRLEWLDLDHNAISDLSPLENLTNLTYLDLNDNRVSDVFPLRALTNLTQLDLDDNRILDISALQNMKKLTLLDLHDNLIIDVSPLNALINLRVLDLDDNQIVDVSPLVALVNLKVLDLDGNRISDVSPLKNLVNLTVLDLSDNHISDFTPIAGVIKNLMEYDASGQTAPSPIEADVNRDSVVDLTDLVLAAAYYQKPSFADAILSGIHPDVNGDGVIDVRDLVAIAAEIDSGAAAAPLPTEPSQTFNFTVETLKHWIHLAKQLDPQEPQTRRGIVVLNRLLTALNVGEARPKATALLANYPNPFNPETWIPYDLAEDSEVKIDIYNVKGECVRQLSLGFQSAGTYRSQSRAAYWDGQTEFGEFVASGVYFYTFTAGDDFMATGKMLIRK